MGARDFGCNVEPQSQAILTGASIFTGKRLEQSFEGLGWDGPSAVTHENLEHAFVDKRAGRDGSFRRTVDDGGFHPGAL